MLGLDADKMAQTFARGGPEAKKSFEQVLQMIAAIEDPIHRNAVGVALMGTQFEDLEAPVIAAMGIAQKQFDMTKNSMGALNEVKFNKPGEALAIFARQIEIGILIPIGEKMLPYLNQFGQWMADHQPKIKAVGDIIGDNLGASITFVNNAISFLVEHMDIIGPALAGFALVILYALIPAFTAWIAAQWAASVAGWAAVAPWLPFIAIGLAVAAVITGIIYAFKNWGAISAWLTEKWEQFKVWMVGLFQSLLTYLIGNFNMVWSTVTGVWNNITGFLSGINLFEIGKNIIQGMIDGVGSMATALMDKMKAIGDGITDKIKTILGIHSPSRVMMDVGFYTGEGLAQGIESTQARVTAASTGLADDVTAPHDTPAASLPPTTAAGASSAGAGGGTVRMEIVIKIDASGGADAKQTSGAIATELKPTLQEIIQSAARRLGVVLVVEET